MILRFFGEGDIKPKKHVSKHSDIHRDNEILYTPSEPSEYFQLRENLSSVIDSNCLNTNDLINFKHNSSKDSVAPLNYRRI